MKRLGLLLIATALLAAACGTTSDTTTTSPPATTAATTTAAPTTTTAAPTTTTTEPPTTTTTEPPTTTTTTTEPPTTTTTLAGQPIDYGPGAGDQVAVVGVQYDDVLNLRELPGTNQPILKGLPPLYDRMIAQGNAWMMPNSFWYEVEADGTVGWVSARFVAYIGYTDDVTSQIVADVGEIPVAPTMEELADIVADSLKSQGEPESRITVTKAATVGDLGEITIDIIGFGDDALFGIRVVVFGQPGDAGFSLMAVESTALCGRGVTDDGFCV